MDIVKRLEIYRLENRVSLQNLQMTLLFLFLLLVDGLAVRLSQVSVGREIIYWVKIMNRICRLYFTDELYHQKGGLIYQHVYESYYEYGKNVYAGVLSEGKERR